MKNRYLLAYRLGLLALCWLALALRLYLLEDIFLNEDEEKSQLLYVRQPAAQILLHYEANNHWLTSGLGHLLGQLGQQRFLLRWPSVFFGTLAIPLISLAGYWLFGSRKIGLLTAFLLCLSAFHGYWSQQFRGYSALLFFSLLALLLLYRALQTGRPKYWWGFSGSMVLALASHLYGVLALSVAIVVLLRGSRGYFSLKNPQQRWISLVGVIAGVFSSYFFWFGKHYVINAYHPMPKAALLQLIYYQWLAFWPTLPEISNFFKGLALAFTAHPHEGMALLLWAGLGLGGWFFCSARFPQATSFLALWLLCPITLVIIAEFTIAGFFVLNRFLIFILPAWLLLIVGGVTVVADRLASRWAQVRWRRTMVSLGLILISLSYLSWLNLRARQVYFTTQAANDWRGVAAYLADQLKPTDLVICNRVLHRSPPQPDEESGCVLELRRRLAELAVPIKTSKIVGANDIQLRREAYGSTAPGTVWIVVWGLNTPTSSPDGIVFDRLGYTRLLKIDTGPTLAANLAQAVDPLLRLDLALPASTHRLSAEFDHPSRIRLIGYLLPSSLQAGQSMPITTFWQALLPISEDYTIFLHLQDRQGQTVTQLDFRPFEGTYPTSQWLPGSTIAETRLWPLPPDLPPGPYTLQAGLYQIQSLVRLPLNGNDPENAISLGEVWLE